MAAEKNWAKNVTYSASEIVQPASLDELAEVISSTPKLRMLGSRHTFSRLGDTDGILVSLEKLADPNVELVQTGGHQAVRVAAGTRYGDFVEQLDGQGFALANLASLPHISVGGAVQTGTHGSGDKIANLSSQVVAVELITGAGEQLRLTREDPEFAGAIVSLGALGAVTHLELAIEPSYQMTQTVYDGVRWADVLERFDEFTSSGDSVSILSTWVEEDQNVQQVFIKHRSETSPDLSGFGGKAATEQRHTVLGDDPAPVTTQGKAGPWHARLPHFRLDHTPSSGEEIQTEYLVPREEAPAALTAYRKLGEQIAPNIFVAEVRTMAGDDLWLSPAEGRDTVGIHCTWKPDEAKVRELLPKIEAALPDTARPHWGKVFELSPDQVKARYSRWDDFAELAAKHDPQRRFVNAYLEAYGL